MSMDSTMRRLRVAENTVELDGVNIARDLSHIEIAANGRECEAVLHLHEAHSLDLDLLATVSVAKPTCAEDIDRFLASVDPQKLERASLDRMQGGNLTSVMLDTLREWARNWES
jgi:hypothetical protein